MGEYNEQGGMHMREDELQTISRSYQEICEGKDPWLPLGNFMHDFFGSHTTRRKKLVKEPLRLPEHPTPEQHRWAVFCAASVEYLCQKYQLPIPHWVYDPVYTLSEAWYYSPYADLPDVRQELEAQAPEPFKRRNIYCNNRVFANKYEIAADLQQRRSA
jgi:hypothetical protein